MDGWDWWNLYIRQETVAEGAKYEALSDNAGM